MTPGCLAVEFSGGAGPAFQVLAAFAIFMAALYARAVADRDRATRLEARWRCRSLLPEDLQGRIDGLATDHRASRASAMPGCHR